MPKALPPKTRQAKAAQVVATLQGAMMVANNAKDHALVGGIVRALLADAPP